MYSKELNCTYNWLYRQTINYQGKWNPFHAQPLVKACKQFIRLKKLECKDSIFLFITYSNHNVVLIPPDSTIHSIPPDSTRFHHSVKNSTRFHHSVKFHQIPPFTQIPPDSTIQSKIPPGSTIQSIFRDSTRFHYSVDSTKYVISARFHHSVKNFAI